MDKQSSAKTDYIPEQVLVEYRRRSEEGWKQILSMTDVLDKAFVELSISSEDQNAFDPYDTSSRLKKLTA